ncbi:addiction module toxin RelE [Streptomyces sp. NPDC001552]|uniref:addiction module toxin RelE n=1 Tax=Streptomyces sp. NPDC001552 TaxID=3364587 RepID=UPI00367E4D3C
MPTNVVIGPDVQDWLRDLKRDDRGKFIQVSAIIDALREEARALGWPPARLVEGESLGFNELCPMPKEIRIIFKFDSLEQAVLLVVGDGEDNWNQWYPEAIKKAEQLFAAHLDTLSK